MRVLIVEDDRLVRKGFISLMPWEQFGMEVIGEAGNGEDALAFLNQQEVDLLITDLSMPRMSGIELIRAVRQLYPRIWTVILTFHQDFEYIQEALRLGAIDYIAKTELQQDKMEEVLGRIEQRIQYETNQQARAWEENERVSPDQGIVWISAHASGSPHSSSPVYCGKSVEESAPGIWFLPCKEADLSDDHLACLLDDSFLETGIVMIVSGIGSESGNQMIRTLQDYRDRFMLYEWDQAPSRIQTRRLEQLKETVSQRPITHEEEQKLKEAWSSLQWVIHDQQYEENLADLEAMKLTQRQLDSLFILSSTRWERVVPAETWRTPQQKLPSWQEWKQWLGGLRQELASYLFKPSYSQEVISCVWKAAQIIHQDLSREITLREVAKEVNLSQSYLSQCFRDIVGVSFNDYVRQARIDWAKQLLVDTDKPIYWIATQTGYPNEKYFSRVFKDKTGMLPSAFRCGQKERG
ncbi:response regulator [Paenibacillus sp.]|jgi:two-component system response regulator YesN|uniref:response regulator transcription factor n=1 Tax=Paenibacillus sp. TaxID=58172 RepID=UPI002839F693|nr:response regulator [Paenibacillus sp.]MDR0269902.1 response regulator [Paenibacillus sp.]